MRITKAEEQELHDHAKRVLDSMEITDSMLRLEVELDLSKMFRREFGLHERDLDSKYLYEAHELIDCYNLPLYLWERVEAEKGGIKCQS